MPVVYNSHIHVSERMHQLWTEGCAGGGPNISKLHLQK